MQAATDESALVVLSGGQDSTTCLYWAIDRFGTANVYTMSFDYGQRHKIELECAARIAEHASVSNVCLPINTFAAIGGDALTESDIAVANSLSAEGGLPNTFVPGRNLVFLTFAAAYAYQRGIEHLVTGVAQTDYSGYPDCREDTIRALQQTLRAGMESAIVIHTPLMHMSKKETVELAVQFGALPALALTHTCYNGERPPCGECPACQLRAKGFAEAGIQDPLLDSR
ncbi:MAG: 7-cyano-7-deazaguanine synthase QueC [Gammaproteobacteria bacterium]|nr:7-cyano-7-deazaguanine synthase QueC [Gammaproteobacteria bacterium]MBT8111069.1 7-cyano-7-deazaguanine synthase QueC [Gammaproteobacteria bacterium]NND47986.1 7-cyano-7-deazaguanine synthase QueC [Woeseiaceae bacterium]NNL45767.1 7-cyano-7-deazaguanine synthase QueC [Woeseiaceae bacterium]